MALSEPTIQARKQRKFTMFWHKKKIDVNPQQAGIKPSVEIVSGSIFSENYFIILPIFLDRACADC
jgi:hypothetical protein